MAVKYTTDKMGLKIDKSKPKPVVEKPDAKKPADEGKK